MAGKLYDENSIQSLDPREFTRLRPGTYAGDTTYSTQLLYEIVANAIDEHKVGHGNKIEVVVSNNPDTFRVRDYGQGFLVNSFRDDGKSILESSFSVLNTSGKYTDDGVYEGTALGLNGIGAKLTNFLSHWLEVTTYRDGKYEKVFFKEGIFESREVGETKEPSGTEVVWQPSEEFFTNTIIDLAAVKRFFEVVVCLCPGLEIDLNIRGQEPIRFYSEAGINDLIDQAVGKREILKNRLVINFSDNKNKLDLVLTYTDSYSTTIVPYINTGLTESGPHITQIKTLITREMNKFFREKGWLKDKDENLSGEDCQSGLYLVFNLTTLGVAYNAQTKGHVVKLDMKPFTTTIAEELQFWLAANEKDVKKIADRAINERKAREAARKARDSARGVKSKKESGLRAKAAISSKFTNCAKGAKTKNLLLVEGQSAAASAIEARDPKRDCIYQLRGKIISPLRTSIDKLLANQEISDIVSILGGGFGSSFDVSKVKYDKIVITSDADSDGAHIELLLITFFYQYMRPLVEAGKLYRAVTPLYIVRHKGKEYYCYSDAELDEWKGSHTGSYDLLRAKG